MEETVVPGTPLRICRLSVEGELFPDDTGERVFQSLGGEVFQEGQEIDSVPEIANSNCNSHPEQPEKVKGLPEDRFATDATQPQDSSPIKQRKRRV
jgi:hypothetical protein